MKWPSLPLICFSVALPTSVFAQAQTIERQFKGNLNTDINVNIFHQHAREWHCRAVAGDSSRCSAGTRKDNRQARPGAGD